MTNKTLIVGFLFFILFFSVSCSSKNTEVLDQKVFEDIFPELVEKIFTDFRKLPIPPPPPKNNSKEEIDEMHLAFKKAKENHKRYLDTTKFAPLFIIVEDSVRGHSKNKVKALYSHYNKLNPMDTTIIKNSFKINLSKILLGDDYILKYRSQLKLSLDKTNNNERLKYSNREKHLRQYSGILYLNRIYFNETKDYGVMEVGYDCGKLCGCGH